MSKKPDTPTVQPLTQDQAWATMMQRVYIPAFVEKMAADYGVKFDTQEQLEQALTRASQLRELHDQEQQQKQASVVDEMTAFGGYLDDIFHSNGLAQQPTANLVKTAAARGALDPELAHAALSLAVGDLNTQPA